MTRLVWIWGQPPHLLPVVGEVAFPVIQEEGQFDSLTVTLGEVEVQGESRDKKKNPESSYKPAGSMQREEERRKEKLVIHQLSW